MHSPENKSIRESALFFSYFHVLEENFNLQLETVSIIWSYEFHSWDFPRPSNIRCDDLTSHPECFDDRRWESFLEARIHEYIDTRIKFVHNPIMRFCSMENYSIIYRE